MTIWGWLSIALDVLGVWCLIRTLTISIPDDNHTYGQVNAYFFSGVACLVAAFLIAMWRGGMWAGWWG